MAFTPAHTTETGVVSATPTDAFSPSNSIVAGHGYTVGLGGFITGVTSVVASNGDTLTKAKEQENSSADATASEWYCLSSAGGTPTITITAAGSGGPTAYFFTEWNQAIGSVRGTNSQALTSTTPNSGSATVVAGDLAVAVLISSGDTWTNYPTTGWTDLGSAVPGIANSEYQAITGSGSVTATATIDNVENWAALVVVYEPPGGASVSASGSVSATFATSGSATSGTAISGGAASARFDDAGSALVSSPLSGGAGSALLAAAAVATVITIAAGQASTGESGSGDGHSVTTAPAASASFRADAAGSIHGGSDNVGSAKALFSAAGALPHAVVDGRSTPLAGSTGQGTAVAIQFTLGAASARFTASGVATTSTGASRDITITIALLADPWAITMGDDVPREIHTSLGGQEYVGLTISETSGKLISTDAVQLTLGSYTVPGTWRDPDLDNNATPRIVRVLVGDTYNPTAGEYYVWMRLPDAPEIVVRRFDGDTILID